jgi:hypothetical protein
MRTAENGWSEEEAGMAQLDDIIGSVMNYLKDNKLDGDTIIAFHSTQIGEADEEAHQSTHRRQLRGLLCSDLPCVSELLREFVGHFFDAVFTASAATFWSGRCHARQV